MKSKSKRKKKAQVRTLRPSRSQSHVAPRTATQYDSKPERFKNLWERVVGVISKMRSEKTSLQKASREAGISPHTVVRWGGTALQKRSNGRYSAKSNDRLLRVLMVPTPEGKREIAVRGSRQATLLAEYWNAVHRYLETGDASRLAKFKGKYIKDASGAQVLLPTDRAELNRLGSAGVLSFESLYSRSA
jgi:hypothetical protein